MKSAKKYRINNPEKIKESKKIAESKKPEKYQNMYREYYFNNKKGLQRYRNQWRRETEKGKACNQRSVTKRRAKEREIINTLTSEEWLTILEEHNYICFYCGVEFDCENLPTRDHVIPIDKGGHNIKENIVPACKRCNAKKSNKILKGVTV